jgi:cytochrome b pre-mRNA-processing protein 3
MLKNLFANSASRKVAAQLYLSAVEQARQPVFYARWGVADSVDGRFDMIAAHVFLVLRKLKSVEQPVAAETAQALFDAMFDDMDRSLREMGAGDLGVGRRVKVMASALSGRIEAYEEGLSAEGDDRLRDAVVKNVFRGEPGREREAVRFARYFRGQDRFLEDQSIDKLVQGEVSFDEGVVAAMEGVSK